MNRKMCNCFCALLALSMLCSVAHAVDDPVNPWDPVWSFEYLGQDWASSDDGTPTETPEWTKQASGAGTVALGIEGDDEFLSLNSGASDSLYYRMFSPTWTADMSAGLTIEFRARVNEYTNSGQIWFADNALGAVTDNFLYAELRGNTDGDPAIAGAFWLQAGDGKKEVLLDTTEWHTFRITTSGGTVNVYVDNNPIVALTGDLRDRTGGANSLEFGDRGGSNANFDLDYMRVYLDGAVPVPEPTSIALLGLAGTFLARRRRRS